MLTFYGKQQTVCGMSVVDGDWDELKKYNMTELYNQAAGITSVGQKNKEKQEKKEKEAQEQKEQQQQQQDEKKPESAKEAKEETAKDTKEEEKPASTDA